MVAVIAEVKHGHNFFRFIAKGHGKITFISTVAATNHGNKDNELRPMIIPDSDILLLNNYLQIFRDYPYGDRAPEFTGKDEKIIEQIYNRWRGTEEIVINCDECLEEAFNRLMEQLLSQIV